MLVSAKFFKILSGLPCCVFPAMKSTQFETSGVKRCKMNEYPVSLLGYCPFCDRTFPNKMGLYHHQKYNCARNLFPRALQENQILANQNSLKNEPLKLKSSDNHGQKTHVKSMKRKVQNPVRKMQKWFKSKLIGGNVHPVSGTTNAMKSAAKTSTAVKFTDLDKSVSEHAKICKRLF